MIFLLNRRSIWKSFSHGLSLLCLVSCARGTEVGNGNRQDPSDSRRESSEIPTSEMDDSGGPIIHWSDWLLAPCASPLREAIDQSLTLQDSDETLLIEYDEISDTRTVSILSKEMELEPLDPNDIQNFEIIVRPLSDDFNWHPEDYECGTLDLSVANDGSLQRSVSVQYAGEDAELHWSKTSQFGIIERIEIKIGEVSLEIVGGSLSD